MPEKNVPTLFFNGNHNFQESGQDSPISPSSSDTLKPSRKQALVKFRRKIEDAITQNYIMGKINKKIPIENEDNLKNITLWGVPLLPSKNHESTDTILIKFLKEKDFRVSPALKKLQKTLKWRLETKVDGILEENFGSDFENVDFIKGRDKLGHPLCYIKYGAFQGKELVPKVNNNGGEENWEEFKRWNIQFMEKCIQEVDFKPGGISAVVQIIDLKDAPEPLINSIRLAGKKSVLMCQQNYPGIICKTLIINCPLWFSAYHAMDFRYITQKSKNKLIFVRPSKVTETLIKYINPEILPVEYGGLNRDTNLEFSPQDKVLQQKLRGGATEKINICADKAGATVVWNMTVVGMEVNYKEEFIPSDDCSYKVMIKKEKKMEEAVITNSFHITEPGNIVITIQNTTFKKKLILYRHKIKPFVPNYSTNSPY